MKTKNTRVRAKDIKQGVTIYVSHPVYGIEKRLIESKPYTNKHTGSLFVDSITQYETWDFKDNFSLNDAGISPGKGYNGRRSFFKLKHAEEWARKMKTDPAFSAQQARHEESNKIFDEAANW